MLTSIIYLGIPQKFKWRYGGRKVYLVIVKEEEELMKEPMFLTKDIASLNEYFEVEIVIIILLYFLMK
jgi:hypothetical protein